MEQLQRAVQWLEDWVGWGKVKEEEEEEEEEVKVGKVKEEVEAHVVEEKVEGSSMAWLRSCGGRIIDMPSGPPFWRPPPSGPRAPPPPPPSFSCPP